MRCPPWCGRAPVLANGENFAPGSYMNYPMQTGDWREWCSVRCRVRDIGDIDENLRKLHARQEREMVDRILAGDAPSEPEDPAPTGRPAASKTEATK